MTIGVVVLNYKDYCSTIRCVESLLCCSPRPARIVIVDNDSRNESFTQLTRRFINEPIIQIIKSGKNGGYAFGNNVGIRWLRKAGVQHVTIATSDTVVVSQNLFAQLSTVITENVGLVGPRVILSNGREQIPSVERLTVKYIVDLLWIQHGMPGLWFRRKAAKAYRKYFRNVVNTTNEYQEWDCQNSKLVVQDVYGLHGSFVCLCNAYLNIVGVLDERIFLFGEEDLLAWACERHHLRCLLVISAQVRHENDASIQAEWGSKAQVFIDHQQRLSGQLLRDEIPVTSLIRTWRRKRRNKMEPILKTTIKTK